MKFVRYLAQLNAETYDDVLEMHKPIEENTSLSEIECRKHMLINGYKPTDFTVLKITIELAERTKVSKKKCR